MFASRPFLRAVAIAGPLVSPFPAIAAAPPAAVAAAAPVPVLNWQPCTNPVPAQPGFDCATAPVPLDYSKPYGETITLALIRHKATDQAKRIGSLFFNPGGPGASGVLLLPFAFTLSPLVLFPTPLRERFDIISWDPRGIGSPDRFSSTPSVQCFSSPTEELAYFDRLPAGVPATPEQRRAWIDGNAVAAQTCAASDSAYLLPHVSTTDTARDLDLLRRAVGDKQVNYQGNSYGTLIGDIYANLFPDKVRAMMLIGNEDAPAYTNSGNEHPILSTSLRQNVEQGTAKTLNAFLTLCGQASTTECAFSAGTAAATQQKWRTLLQRVRTNPVIVASNPPVTYDYDRVVTYAVVLLYSPLTEWPELANTLEAVWERSTDPSRYLSPTTPLGQQPTQSSAVTCGETPNPRNPAAYFGLAALATVQAGAVGPYWVWSDEKCAAWPATAADQYTGPWNNPTNPILLVNITHDPATPHSEAVTMANTLANARLLTIDGYGHADGGIPSTCAANYVASYFVDGTLPPKGTVCQQDQAPFTTGSGS
jgi:pimeloyl-ACP methyl ester carboxylesterase